MFYILMNMKSTQGHFREIEINYLSKYNKGIFHDKNDLSKCNKRIDIWFYFNHLIILGYYRGVGPL